MKPSHFQTPRSLDDCAFVPSADPIERQNDDSYYAPVYLACIAAAAFCAYAVIVWG